MKTSIKYFLAIGLAVLAIVSGYRYYYKATKGFTIASITPERFVYHPDWKNPELSPEEETLINAILKQPFTYLGKGGQAYAFESQDGRYVLKFIKFKYLRHNPLYRAAAYIPFFEDLDTNEMQRKQKKVNDLYQGYHLAYSLNRENSGLLYIHFNPTFNKFGSVKLVDRIGRPHSIDLDQIVFIIQEKGILFNALLDQALDQGNLQDARNKILGILDMYSRQYQKGLYDRDYGVLHNAGFVDERPIHIDLGKMTFDARLREKKYAKADMDLVAAKIKEWIHKEHPQHFADMNETINSYTEDNF